jgi:glycosyltransferase involved in cell wall biosynthesis
MGKISIIVTSYKSQDFIEDCLDSIASQTCGDYEILLGIDGCVETLIKVKEIKHKYKNLKVFYSVSNVGTYVLSNSLILKSDKNCEYLLRFDSDDIMKSNLIEVLSELKGDVYQFKADNYIKSKYKNTKWLDGILYFNKKIIENIGYYKNWRCGADTDFINRIKFANFKIIRLDKVLYNRNIRNSSLTKSKDFGFGSPYRQKIAKQVAKKFEKIEATTTTLIEI